MSFFLIFHLIKIITTINQDVHTRCFEELAYGSLVFQLFCDDIEKY